MSIIKMIKNLLGLAGVDETTATAIGGAAQMAAGMKQSSDNAGGCGGCDVCAAICFEAGGLCEIVEHGRCG